MNRLRVLGGIACVVAAAGATVLAGGWAVVTVRELPDSVPVGEVMRLDLEVRQHGHSLVSAWPATVEARLGSRVVNATVRPLAEPGTYRAEAVLPVVGTWTLTISSGLFDVAKVSLPAVKEAGTTVSFAADERGQRLFSAKGCATCHRHEATSDTRSTDVGPALTGRHYPAAVVAAQVRHPKPCESGRPCMPVLTISDADIAGLAAFLNRDSGQVAQR